MKEITRVTPQQATRVRHAVRKNCCNCIDGNCLLLDGLDPCPCPQLITRSLVCRWFLAAVLPGEKELQRELMGSGVQKICKECGAPYYAESNRSKYCADCAIKVKRRQQAEYAKRKRARVEK